MILQAIEVRHLRGIEHLRLEGLSPRLNLISGPNESGKSTLVEALHLAFFERSSGEAESKRALQTWGGHEPPEIHVRFLTPDGVEWSVDRRFLQRPETVVFEGSRRLNNEAAERRLRELFGAQTPSRTGWDRRQVGIWRMLWVPQGEAGLSMSDALTEDARAQLAGTLSQQTGVVLDGADGQAILQQARDLAADLWSPSGKPGPAVKAADEAVVRAREAVADLEERQRQVRKLVTDLARARSDVEALRPRLQVARGRLDAVEQRARAARLIKAELDQHLQQGELLRLRHEAALRQVHQRTTTAEILHTATAQRPALVEVLVAARRAHTGVAERRQHLRRQRDVAEQQAVAARDVVRRVRRQQERAALQGRIGDLRATAEQAEQRERQQVELQRLIDPERLTAADVERVEDLQREVDATRARLGEAAVRLTLVATADLVLDGEPIAAGQRRSWSVSEPRHLVLPQAEIHIEPSAGATNERRMNVDKAERDLRSRLDALHATNLADLRARLERKRQRSAALETVRAELRLLAPKGIAPLRVELETAQAALATLEADAGLPELPGAISSQEAAERAWDELRAAHDATERPLEQASAALSQAEAALRQIDADIEGQTARLAELPPADELDAAEAAAASALSMVQAAAAALQRRLDDAGATEPELLRHQRSVQQIERELDALREAEIRLDATLRGRSDDGLTERLTDALTALDHAEAEAARLQRRAQALRVLVDTLEAARQRLHDRFASPVRQAIERHARLLFPSSTLLHDERGDVIGLRTRLRGGEVTEPLPELSAGARDQLGVLVRLGVAEVLCAGTRRPLVLDDALVNSDALRRDRMIEVLHQASEHLQLLVFTCHDDDFDALGADRVYRIGADGRRQRAPVITSARR